MQWNPDFSNLQGKRKLVREIGGGGGKLQCLTEERERLLVRVIERLEKMRVREIGIPLYVMYVCNLFTHGTPRSSQEFIQKCPCIPGLNWN